MSRSSARCRLLSAVAIVGLCVGAASGQPRQALEEASVPALAGTKLAKQPVRPLLEELRRATPDRPVTLLDLVATGHAPDGPADVAGVRGPGCTGVNCPARDGGNAILSELFPFAPNRVADDFRSTAAGGSVSSICFWGVYGDNAAPAAGEDFRVRFFRDNNGVPGTLLRSVNGVLNSNMTRAPSADPLLLGIFTIFEYNVTISPALSIPASTCLWVEVVSDGDNTGGWFWVQTLSGANNDARYATVSSATAPYQDFNTVVDDDGVDMAWCVNVLLDNPGICSGAPPSGQCSQDIFAPSCQDRDVLALAGVLSDDAEATAAAAQTIADDWNSAATGDITELCWWGFYNTPIPPTTDLFTVTIFNDTNGLPGPVLATFTQGANMTVQRGWSGDAAPVFEYKAAIPAGAAPLIGGNCYWIEVVNTTAAAGWFWSISASGNGFGAVDGAAGAPLDGYTVAELLEVDVAFCVSQDINLGLGCPFNPAIPANNECSNAVPLTINGPPLFDPFDQATQMPGTTSNIGATSGIQSFPLVPPCGIEAAGVGDVWFSVVGNGNELTVSTCSVNTDFDTYVAVYCPSTPGDCLSGLNCVAANDDAGASCAIDPFQSSVSWISESGVTYFIRVSGLDAIFDNIGNFEISVSGVVTPDPADACEPQCDVTGDTADVLEAELCQDAVNGTCATTTQVLADFTTVGPQEFFGQMFADGDVRDLDSFGFDVPGTEATFVDFRIRTEVPMLFLINNQRDNCAGTATLIALIIPACLDVTEPTLSILLPAGQYWVLMAPTGFNGAPCGTFNDYTVGVSSTPIGQCCLPDGNCTVIAEFSCAAQDGVYAGDGTDCSNANCAITFGACCLPDDSCVDVSNEQQCIDLGGTYQGATTECFDLAGMAQSFTSAPGVPIPDNTPAGVTDVITVPGSFPVGDVRVFVNIPNHTFISDLLITLSHNGTDVIVWGNQCAGEDGLSATFSDDGDLETCASPTTGTILSLFPLGVFNGTDAGGDWSLNVADLAALDAGTLADWAVIIDERITVTDCASARCVCDLTDGMGGGPNGLINVFDLLAYLQLWFPMNPAADIDGTPGVNVFDLLAFLNCWFPASAGNPCP